MGQFARELCCMVLNLEVQDFEAAQATKNNSGKIIETLSLLAGNSTRAWARDILWQLWVNPGYQ